MVHQKQASDHRLGLPRQQNTSLQKASFARSTKQVGIGQQGLGRKGTSRTQTISDRIRAVKDDKDKIKITAVLYTFKNDEKFVKVFLASSRLPVLIKPRLPKYVYLKYSRTTIPYMTLLAKLLLKPTSIIKRCFLSPSLLQGLCCKSLVCFQYSSILW